jgi:hypothetical protein
MNTFDIEEVNRHLQVIGAVAATIFILLNGKKYNALRSTLWSQAL